MGKFVDMTGKRFGRLVALRPIVKSKNNGMIWEFKCDCGKVVEIIAMNVRKGATKSCGCLKSARIRQRAIEKSADMIGKKFGRWEVLELLSNDGKNKLMWKVKCDCGNLGVVDSSRLKNGKSKSCGCIRVEKLVQRSTKHGCKRVGKETSEYRTWKGIIQRCTNPNMINYKDYGDRGIKVCSRWRNSFEAFLEDMGPRPTGKYYSIDRIDNGGDYSPENCKWATRTEQNRNSRHNSMLTYNEEIHCVSEWAEILGVNGSMLRNRIRRGWSTEEVLTTLPNEDRNAKK